MYPFIICTCGRSLGDLYDIFAALRNEKYETIGDGNPSQPLDISILSFNNGKELMEIWDILHINLECCKTKLTYQQKMSNYY